MRGAVRRRGSFPLGAPEQHEGSLSLALFPPRNNQLEQQSATTSNIVANSNALVARERSPRQRSLRTPRSTTASAAKAIPPTYVSPPAPPPTTHHPNHHYQDRQRTKSPTTAPAVVAHCTYLEAAGSEAGHRRLPLRQFLLRVSGQTFLQASKKPRSPKSAPFPAEKSVMSTST